MSKVLQNKTNKALVSIIIPFFNREDFLSEAVESVLAQTYQNWELILVDDGSSDYSQKIAQKFVKKYPHKIFLYAHKDGKNRGASSSRNLGIKHSNGDFITFLDSDDVFLSKTLEMEIAAFEQNPDAEVVCGTLQYWFSWSERQNKTERDFFVNLGLTTGKLYDPPSLFIHNMKAGGRKPGIGCIIIRRSFAQKVTLFEDDFNYVCEDQIFWAKISLYAKTFVLNDCLAKYRQHPLSSSSILIHNGNLTADWERFLNWLESYLAENKIEDQNALQAFKLWKKENRFRAKYQLFLNLYQRIFPYHIRYRIRDFIIRRRMAKSDNEPAKK